MRIAFGILAVVALVHLTGQLAGPTLLAHSTQVLLMPALAGVLLAGTTAPRGRLVHLVLVALLFSWLGDSVTRFTTGDTSFLLMVGFFLSAQLVYVVALWPYRHASLLRRPAALAAYGGCGIWSGVLCARQAWGLPPAGAGGAGGPVRPV